nr:peptidoglycan DD-metalloendopeptidase family protein [Alteromonas sp. 5E99-2]
MKFVLLTLLIFSSIFCVQAQTSDASQSEKLKALQNELAERQRKLQSNLTSAEELKAILKRSELAIAATAKALNNTQNELSHNSKEQASLKVQAENLKERVAQQQSQLAAQVRSAYMAGNYDYAKMVLNQDDALRFERVLTYYQYFNKARQSAISQFRSDIQQLESINKRLEEAAVKLKALLKAQTSQTEELKARKEDRQITLAKLNSAISSQSDEIAVLLQNEEALIKAINEAEEARQRARENDLSLNGLSKFKGTLLVPAKGRVQKLYGKRRQGQVRWKGIIIEGAEGGAVNAIHQGRVLYADWLKGFGLVIIIDHGEGYMSVYGHNQALLKKAGDTVRSGEAMALLGQSGGQAYPNLYFEIRHKGKALNPMQWVDF